MEDEKETAEPVFEVKTSVFARKVRPAISNLAERMECRAVFHLPVGAAVDPYRLYVQTKPMMQPLILDLHGVASVGASTAKTIAETPPPVLIPDAPKPAAVLKMKPPEPSPYSDTYPNDKGDK